MRLAMNFFVLVDAIQSGKGNQHRAPRQVSMRLRIFVPGDDSRYKYRSNADAVSNNM